jgi:hypothetical protein
VHEGDEPDALADLGDADVLAGTHVAEIHLPAFEADPAAVSHRDRLVIKRVRQVVEAVIDARWSRVEIGPSYFGGSTLIVAVGPTPAVRIHIGSFPDPS